MSSITVFFYGYKSKELPQAVESLLQNKSGQNNIDIYVYDQTNIIREDKFPNVAYNHIFWDNRTSMFSYLENLLSQSQSDFFLYINGALKFEKNWDIELVMGHGRRPVIISGNHGITFNAGAYKFYPSYEISQTQTALITNWITNDFIFMTTEMFKSFPKLSDHIKWMGLEEVYSVFAHTKGFMIQCLATAWASKLDGSIFDHDYLPFSIKHGYNKIIDLFQQKQNCFFNDPANINRISVATGFDFSQLKYLPFPHDDVSYNPIMEMDSIGEERFIENIRSIR